MAGKEPVVVGMVFVVSVDVDPTDIELLSAVLASGSLSVADAVRSEIESNLESVSYVRHVSIAMNEETKGGVA